MRATPVGSLLVMASLMGCQVGAGQLPPVASASHAVSVTNGLTINAFVQNAFVQNAFVQNAFVQNAFVQNAFVQNAFVQNGFQNGALTLDGLAILNGWPS